MDDLQLPEKEKEQIKNDIIHKESERLRNKLAIIEKKNIF